jgi:hypothetical protein
MIMTLQRDDKGSPDRKINEPQAEDLWKEIRVDGLVYRVQSISPETADCWRTAIRPLVLFSIAIFAAAALVGIFGAPLREWAKATPVFRPFLANEMPLASPAVRIPASVIGSRPPT